MLPDLLSSVRAQCHHDNLPRLLEWLPPERVDALILLAEGQGRQRCWHSSRSLTLSSDIRFWSSGDTKTGPPDGLLTGGLRRPLDRCFIGGCRVVVVGGGICAA